ncbi:MAG: M56 family metallopeptidase [Longimicrobiales bacterium]
MHLLEWMLRAAVLAILVGTGARALEQVLRDAQRATRFVWVGALLLSIALPFLALTLPDVWPDSMKRGGGMIVLPEDLAVADGVVAESQAVIPASRALDNLRWSARDVVLGVWSLAALLLGLRWLYGWQKLRVLRARWREAMLAGERVLISDEFGPAVVGLMRPRVVVPSWLLAGDAERQHMIVRHEVEHTRAGDPWLLALAPILIVLFPWNPALWWQLRRLRLAIELDCDARVLRGGVSALAYGSMLLDVAGGATITYPTLAALAEPRTSLERRIRAMTPIRYRYALTRAATLMVLSILALIGAVIAGAPAAAPASAQERRTVSPQQEGTPLLVVDGKLLAARAQPDLTHLEIASIQVLTPADASRRYGTRGRLGAVVITTRPKTEVSAVEIEADELRKALTEVKVSAKQQAELEKMMAEMARTDADFQKVKMAEIEATGRRGTITGQVIIEETGRPAVKAHVTIGPHSTMTDANGRFVIANVPAGERTLDVRTPGYISRQQVYVAAEAASNVETIQLRAMTDGERAKFEMIRPLSEKDAEKVKVAREKAHLDNEAIQLYKAMSDKSMVDKIRVRDLASGNPLVVVDGVVMGAGLDLVNLLGKLIDHSDIERIEVLKGAAAVALYGERAASGVIHITTKK